VDDPWHGEDEDFDLTWAEAVAAARGLAAALSR
jgi:hypothetical protein